MSNTQVTNDNSGVNPAIVSNQSTAAGKSYAMGNPFLLMAAFANETIGQQQTTQASQSNSLQGQMTGMDYQDGKLKSSSNSLGWKIGLGIAIGVVVAVGIALAAATGGAALGFEAAGATSLEVEVETGVEMTEFVSNNAVEAVEELGETGTKASKGRLANIKNALSNPKELMRQSRDVLKAHAGAAITGVVTLGGLLGTAGNTIGNAEISKAQNNLSSMQTNSESSKQIIQAAQSNVQAMANAMASAMSSMVNALRPKGV